MDEHNVKLIPNCITNQICGLMLFNKIPRQCIYEYAFLRKKSILSYHKWRVGTADCVTANKAPPWSKNQTLCSSSKIYKVFTESKTYKVLASCLFVFLMIFFNIVDFNGLKVQIAVSMQLLRALHDTHHIGKVTHGYFGLFCVLQLKK